MAMATPPLRWERGLPTSSHWEVGSLQASAPPMRWERRIFSRQASRILPWKEMETMMPEKWFLHDLHIPL
eukprot:c18099_g2_i2 orf=156-365(+)